MAKKLFIDPGEMRKSGQIDFSSIPVNQYNKTVQDELENLSKEDLVRIYRDMAIIREFEEMLYAIKTTGNTATRPMITRALPIFQSVRRHPWWDRRSFWIRMILSLVPIAVMGRSWPRACRPLRK